MAAINVTDIFESKYSKSVINISCVTGKYGNTTNRFSCFMCKENLYV